MGSDTQEGHQALGGELEHLLEDDNPDEESLSEFDKTIDFSTDNADYHFHGAVHTRSSELDEVIPEMDALILETGGDEYSDWELSTLANHTQYSSLMDENLDLENPRSIYFADVNCSFLSILSDATKQVVPLEVARHAMSQPEASILMMPVCVSIATFGKTYLDKVTNTGGGLTDEMLGYLQISRLAETGAFRSAVTAKKAEEFIAPRVSEEVDGQPDILIEYGAGHTDIVPYIRHPRIREAVTTLHDKLDYKIDPGLKTEYIDKVAEFDFHENGEELYLDLEEDLSINYDKNFYDEIFAD